MTDLAAQLERLGLEQYLDAFVGEGFDTWETLLDIQESDLEALNVKLGHRRKLQRAIADYRGISYERWIKSPARDGSAEARRPSDGAPGSSQGKEGASAPPAETKRKYRRHPKIDDNAPEKPPSAYVLFSNKIREEIKSENLSFTEIAKLVGDRWQKLDPTRKEPFETQASALKEQYNVKLSAYRKTDSYKEYSRYLSEFKAKHGPHAEPKRPKLDPQSSGGSVSAASADVADTIPLASGHTRVGSIGSASNTSYASKLPSPSGGGSHAPSSSIANPTGTGGRMFSSIHQPGSPQSLQGPPRERRLLGQLSSQSSTSDDSAQIPHDPLSRAATLSLNTPPTGTPPLLPHVLGTARPDQSGSLETYSWSSRAGQPGLQTASSAPTGQSSFMAGITLPSPTFSAEPWRERPTEWARSNQGPLSATATGQAPSHPLPPLLGPQAQRILPPLRPDAHPGSSQTGYPNTSPATHLPRHGGGEVGRRYSQSVEGTSRQHDRHESEAASTLAGLAARPGQDPSYLRDRRRQ